MLVFFKILNFFMQFNLCIHFTDEFHVWWNGGVSAAFWQWSCCWGIFLFGLCLLSSRGATTMYYLSNPGEKAVWENKADLELAPLCWDVFTQCRWVPGRTATGQGWGGWKSTALPLGQEACDEKAEKPKRELGLTENSSENKVKVNYTQENTKVLEAQF